MSTVSTILQSGPIPCTKTLAGPAEIFVHSLLGSDSLVFSFLMTTLRTNYGVNSDNNLWPLIGITCLGVLLLSSLLPQKHLIAWMQCFDHLLMI